MQATKAGNLMGFLDGYEAARARTDRWIATYPTGRIETRIVQFDAEKGFVLVEAKAFRQSDDRQPAGIDHAYGYQGAYVQNMKRWFVEDTCTSAILRVMQLVMGGAERTTRETMEQIEALPAAVAKTDLDYDYWTTKFGEVPSFKTQEEVDAAGTPDSLQQCRHGKRVFREGTAKTGKAWANYSCIEKKPEQCDPNWLVMSSDGKWKPQL
jgi:hypothetical protein